MIIVFTWPQIPLAGYLMVGLALFVAAVLYLQWKKNNE